MSVCVCHYLSFKVYGEDVCFRAVKSVSFSLDGLHVLSGSDDTSVRNWDLATGMCVVTLRGHQVHSRGVGT